MDDDGQVVSEKDIRIPLAPAAEGTTHLFLPFGTKGNHQLNNKRGALHNKKHRASSITHVEGA